jgi:hypothetical protein
MKTSSLLLAALTAALLTTAGCGTAPCGPSNCNGCCNATGLCLSGNAYNACGVKGLACVACSGQQQCELGLCQNVSTCGSNCGNPGDSGHPSDGGHPTDGGHPLDGGFCNGCIDGFGQCQPGNSSQACGAFGQACVTCTTGEACNALGQCQGTTTCNGCIDSNGTCQPGTSSLACGLHGVSCSNCGNVATCDGATGLCVASNPDSGCLHFTSLQGTPVGNVNPDSGFAGLLISQAFLFSPTLHVQLGDQVYESASLTTPLAATFPTTYGSCLDCVILNTGCTSPSSCTKFLLAQSGTTSATKADAVTPGAFAATGSTIHFVEWEYNMAANLDQAVPGGICVDLDSFTLDASW